MGDNECQNSCDLVINLGEAVTLIPHSSLEQSFYGDQGQHAIEADPDPHEMALPFHFSILLKG